MAEARGAGLSWRKLGKIFDPRAHRLPDGCQEFAQSPQTLLLPDRTRIYFSTRSVDPANGKFFSRVAYADFTPDLGALLGVCDHTVLPLGGLGCFDEHGIFPINILAHQGKVYGYTSGWSRRVAVSVETAIGLVVSHDQGERFERVGMGPVLAAAPHEPCLVCDGFVRVIDGLFHMWYIFGTGWKHLAPDAPPDRIYKIAHAVSTDGLTWARPEAGSQLIPDRLGPDECQALPSVLAHGGLYHMVFCYRHADDFRLNRGRGYRIGYAWSENGRDWHRDDERGAIAGEAGAWDGDMQCYPHLFARDGRVYLLYNGNAFGRHGFGAAVLHES
ncbi:MAG: hypothetical protein HQL97_03910 [Magnetococcales bacterium]|nr:hypothetical protein [Magnetococcales bacterium]